MECPNCDGIGTVEVVCASDNMDLEIYNCLKCHGSGRIGEDNKMITNEMIAKNKFYIGSKSVFNRGQHGWGHRTIDGALTHAKGMIELEKEEEVFIVKIVKVIRRKTAPVEVIDVK